MADRPPRAAGPPAVSITVNGEPRAVAAGAGIPALLDQLGLPVRSVVVELNGVALTPSESARATLAEGDTVEIVRAVAGG